MCFTVVVRKAGGGGGGGGGQAELNSHTCTLALCCILCVVMSVLSCVDVIDFVKRVIMRDVLSQRGELSRVCVDNE